MNIYIMQIDSEFRSQMDYQKILNNCKNDTKIVYLDSSSLIRTYPISVLSKNFTRTKYEKNPPSFSQSLNLFIKPLLDDSFSLYNLLTKITNKFNQLSIVTLDCMFAHPENNHILSLFGTFSFKNTIASVNNSVTLYGDRLSAETIYNASALIRSSETIILDDYFLLLPIGNFLLDRKKENTPIYPLSSLIGFPQYKTNDVIDFFSSLDAFSF